MEVEVNFKQEDQLSWISIEQKQKFEELYKKQDQDRQQLKEKKQIINEQVKDPKEKMLYIQQQFNEQYQALQSSIKKFDKKTGDFDLLFDQFKQLKQYFVNTNYALTTYDRYKYKEQLESAENILYQVKDMVRPRKKFQFTKRNNQKTQSKNLEIKEDFKTPELYIPGYEVLRGQKLAPSKQELQGTWKLVDIEDSEIVLNSVFDTVYIKGIRNSKILIGPVKSAVFVENCEGSELFLAAHQIRIHKSHNCLFSIYTTSKPIIEHCQGLVFTQYSHTYDGFKEDFQTSGLDGKTNLWNLVQDFNWLKQEKSPNFQLKE